MCRGGEGLLGSSWLRGGLAGEQWEAEHTFRTPVLASAAPLLPSRVHHPLYWSCLPTVSQQRAQTGIFVLVFSVLEIELKPFIIRCIIPSTSFLLSV